MSDKTWYAIYVKSRAEKSVAKELMHIGVDHYLPLIKRLKQWSDRRKWVEEPLFRSYLFVHIPPSQYYEVLQASGVVMYISFESKAVPIPPQQIEAIRYYLNEKDPEKISEEDWKEGRLVEVISGGMTGLYGQLVESKGKHRVKVEIEVVGQTLLVQVPKNKLRLV